MNLEPSSVRQRTPIRENDRHGNALRRAQLAQPGRLDLITLSLIGVIVIATDIYLLGRRHRQVITELT